MQRADKAFVVRMVMDRHHFDLEVFDLQDDFGARNGKFAGPAVAKAAADHDALGPLPGLGLEEAARDVGELLREVLNGAVHDGPGFAVVADQDRVSNSFLLMFSESSLPNGSSPDLRSGFRHFREFPGGRPCWHGPRGILPHPSVRC
jgi:hypothetical protein